MSSSDSTHLAEPLLVPVRDAARLLSVSPRTLHELTRTGQVPHVRIQRRVLYPVDKLREYIVSITTGGCPK
jgi:excisionase family DNA binding protein